MATNLLEHLRTTLGAAYTIERELGGGGMSRVFLATETAFGRRVVVKVLPPELAGDVSVERFRREIQLAGRLQHPHIVSVLSAGESGGMLYYTMPFVDGESLRTRFVREGPLTIDDAVHNAREIASALEYAHQHGVVHRDIKPENILLSDGLAMVADFGIARAISTATNAQSLTGTGITLGTPAYMSPEQASGSEDVDGRTDIYSLGCLMYEMLAGEPPFTGPTAQAVIAKRFSSAAPALRVGRPSASPSLERIVAKALAPLPADRFQTAGDLVRALDAVIAHPRPLADDVAGADAAVSAPQKTAAPVMPHRAGRMVGYLTIGAVSIAIAAVAYGARRDPDTPGPATAAVAPKAVTAIAVMPFVNIGGDTATEYFADGMTEELMSALDRVEGLRVSARTSVFALRGKQLDARTLGETLGADALVEGSVRRVGQRLRIAATLVSTDSGYRLWSEEYNREMSDVFRLQDEISRAIASALRITLTGRNSRTLVKPPTADPEAHDLYMKARYAMSTREGARLGEGVRYLEQAIDRDPDFALAYAVLAGAHTRLGQLGHVPPDEAFPKARAAAERALALNDSLGEAHASLAHILCVREWKWAEASAEFERAIVLDPDNASVRHPYAVCLLSQGRFKEAERELVIARALDPLLAAPTALLGRLYVVTHQPDSAIRYLREALSLNPFLDLAYQQLGHAYLQQKRYEEAIAAFGQAAALSGARDSAHLAYGYAVAGRRAAATRILRAVLDGPRKGPLPSIDVALAYTGLGDDEEAFRWLERGVTERAPFTDHIKVMSGFDRLRTDARFVALIKRIGLSS